MKILTSSLLAAMLPWRAVAYIDLPHNQPDIVNDLQERQSPGTPEYDCNNYCGGVIAQARIEPSTTYCFSDKFISNLNNCFACANTYGIWSTYGTSVTRAANACGIQPSLQASGNTALTTTLIANPTAASAVGGAGGGLASSGVIGATGVGSGNVSRSTTTFVSASSFTSLNTVSASVTATRTTSVTSSGTAPAVQSISGAAIRNVGVAQGAAVAAAGVLGLIL